MIGWNAIHLQEMWMALGSILHMSYICEMQVFVQCSPLPCDLVPAYYRWFPYRIAGYDEDECDQPWTVPLTLKLLVTIPPVLFIVLSLFCIHLYPITEQSRERTKLILQERRRESVYQASAMDVDQLARQSNDPEDKQQTKFWVIHAMTELPYKNYAVGK